MIKNILLGLNLLRKYKKSYGGVKGKYKRFEDAQKNITLSWSNINTEEYKNNFNKLIETPSDLIHVRNDSKSYNSKGLFSWDYPTLFWLDRIITLPVVNKINIVDFGGNIGIHSYLYNHYLNNKLENSNWKVVEIEKFISLGRSFNKKYSNLFFEKLEDIINEDIEIFHASSSLQYLNDSLLDIIEKFQKKPNYIIINRTPFTKENSFFTIQNGGSSEYVMKVISFEELDALKKYYTIIDDWYDNIDKCSIPFDKSNKVFYKGYILKLK
jgi:putative methyltransferase (TIGR04325 family)